MADFDWTSILGPAIGAWAGYQAGGPETATKQTTLPPEMMGQWNAYKDFANNVANRPYENTVAPFSQDQYSAMDMIRNNAAGTPEMQAGSLALQNFLSGRMGNSSQITAGSNPYTVSAGSNPYTVSSGGGASSATAAQNQYINSNPFLSGGPQNAYMGANPYMDAMIGRSSDEIMNRMNSGAFSSGSFGNSGIASQTGKAIGDATNSLLFQNYNQSANLAENALNRQMSAHAQQGQLGDSDASRLTQVSLGNAQLSESAAQRAMQGSIAQAQLGDSAAQRALQASLSNAQLGDSAAARALQASIAQSQLGENNLNRMASLIPQSINFGNYQNQVASNLLQSGAMQQQQGQNVLNNWWNYPIQQLGIMGQPLNFNTGNTQTQTIPGNEWASALGGGLLGLNFGG